jgi:hypothetical protein
MARMKGHCWDPPNDVCSLQVVVTCWGCWTNKIYIIHIVWHVITMSRMVSRCTQNFYCTSYKQCDQSHSDHNKILVQKRSLSYLDQFLTVFDGPGMEINGNKCGNMVPQGFSQKTSCNQFKPVFHWSYDIFETGQLTTGLKKTGP